MRIALYRSAMLFGCLLAASICAEEPSCEDGFVPLFNGKNLDGWIGKTEAYKVEDGMIVSIPDQSGNMVTQKEYANFVLQFEFLLTPASNNGIGLRMPVNAHAATQGMEIQILDEADARYRNLKPYQYHGSVYGILPAQQGQLRPVGEWNFQEIRCDGSHVTVKLNGKTIVDGDILEATKSGALDGREHPGVKRARGHIGLLGHKSLVKFRNLCIRELPDSPPETTSE